MREKIVQQLYNSLLIKWIPSQNFSDITESVTGTVIRVSSEPLLNEFYDENDNHWVYKALLSLAEPL